MFCPLLQALLCDRLERRQGDVKNKWVDPDGNPLPFVSIVPRRKYNADGRFSKDDEQPSQITLCRKSSKSTGATRQYWITFLLHADGKQRKAELENNLKWKQVLLVERAHSEGVPQEQMEQEVVSADPGLRNAVMMFFSSTGKVKSVGKELRDEIHVLQRDISALQRYIDQRKQDDGPGRHLRGVTRRLRKLQLRIVNLTRTFWRQTASDMASRAAFIVTSKMTSHSLGRKLARSTRRDAHDMALGRFVDQLKWTCSRWGTELFVVCEAFTSKQCGSCYFIHNKLNSSERFNCPQCEGKWDRDAKAARLIPVKLLSELVRSAVDIFDGKYGQKRRRDLETNARTVSDAHFEWLKSFCRHIRGRFACPQGDPLAVTV